MVGDEKRATIEPAQGELGKLQGRGRDMLEAIAASRDPASSAQKVGAASFYTLCVLWHCEGQTASLQGSSHGACTDNSEDLIAHAVKGV